MSHENFDNKTEQYFFQILMGKPAIRALLVEIFENIIQPIDDGEEVRNTKISWIQKVFWKTLPSHKILAGLDHEARMEILELFFGTGIVSLSDLDKRINALKVDASRLWEDDLLSRGVVFDLIFQIIEKMFDISDERFNEYLSSESVVSDEFEAIQMVSDILDMFELQSRKSFLIYRDAFYASKKNNAFIGKNEEIILRTQIGKLSNSIFEEKMGGYVGKK